MPVPGRHVHAEPWAWHGAISPAFGDTSGRIAKEQSSGVGKMLWRSFYQMSGPKIEAIFEVAFGNELISKSQNPGGVIRCAVLHVARRNSMCRGASFRQRITGEGGGNRRFEFPPEAEFGGRDYAPDVLLPFRDGKDSLQGAVICEDVESRAKW
jgi:hypothetical protein